MNDELNNKDISVEETKDSLTSTSQEEVYKIIEWVNQIRDESTRENALAELSKKRESFSDLALYIWYSTGTVSSLLQEIINTYQLLAPPILNIQSSNRACNVLALFQCVAAHPETRPAFLNAQIPIFLYPFLNTVNKNKPFEYLRLTALGVIGALVKIDNPDVINFLLSTEIIPLCLRIMERGSELSKTVATFIVQRILLDENGLNYVCNTAERFYAISTVLYNMISTNPSQRLIKHIIRSYARLAENTRVRAILKENLPGILKEKNFYQILDESSKRWLQNLMKLLSTVQSNGNERLMTGMGNINNMGNMNTLNMNSMNSLGMGGMNNGFMMSQNDLVTPFNNYNENYMENNNSKMNYQMQMGGNKNSYMGGMNSNVFTYKNGK